MVDRPQGQHVFQAPKTMLHFDQVLVPGHGIQRGHVLLAGGNHVATFQTLFVRETLGVFAETKRSIAEFPCIIAITVMGPPRPLLRPHTPRNSSSWSPAGMRNTRWHFCTAWV